MVGSTLSWNWPAEMVSNMLFSTQGSQFCDRRGRLALLFVGFLRKMLENFVGRFEQTEGFIGVSDNHFIVQMYRNSSKIVGNDKDRQAGQIVENFVRR